MFFDKQALTQEQQKRWRKTVLKYNAIRDKNIRELIDNINEIDYQFYTQQGLITDDQIARHIKETSLVAPGDEKSALFARLLQGKDALPSPPPTRNFYPWYSVIEDPGPHQCSIDGVVSTFDQTIIRDCTENNSIIINDCLWNIVSLNSSAIKLVQLDYDLKKMCLTVKNNVLSTPMTIWPKEFLEDVLFTYLNEPEFIVKFGKWKEYRLFSSSRDSIRDGSKKGDDPFMDTIFNESIEKNKPDFSQVKSVFDLDALYLNANIRSIINKNDEKNLTDMKQMYEYFINIGQAKSFSAIICKNAIEKMQRSINSIVSSGYLQAETSDPSNIQQLFSDKWYLEKIK